MTGLFGYRVLARPVSNQWDKINRNLDSVDLDKLESYRSILFELKSNLTGKVENLDAQITSLRTENATLFNSSQINSLTNLKWDLTDELIPVDSDIDGVTNAINTKIKL
jgi:hypothetical protein